MPTGYTAGLYEGEQTFEEFVWRVARGFGALVSMRDAPEDAEIPEEFEPRTEYHDRALAEAKITLAKLDALTPDQADAEAEAEYKAQVAKRELETEKQAGIRERYEGMLAEVEAWEPPTADHIALKETMIQQLRQSIDFDCGGMDHWPAIEPLDGQSWVEQQRERAERDLTYHAAEREKEIQRARSRTAWVQALRESLAVRV